MSHREIALSMNRQEYCTHVIQECLNRMKQALADSYGCMVRDLKDDDRHTPALVQTSNEDLTLFLKLEGVPLRITLGNYTHLAYSAGLVWDYHQEQNPPVCEICGRTVRRTEWLEGKGRCQSCEAIP